MESCWDGPRQRQLRRQRGWSAEDLAVIIRRSSASVRRYETGSIQPSLCQAIAISAALRVPLDTLLTGSAGSDE